MIIPDFDIMRLLCWLAVILAIIDSYFCKPNVDNGLSAVIKIIPIIIVVKTGIEITRHMGSPLHRIITNSLYLVNLFKKNNIAIRLISGESSLSKYGSLYSTNLQKRGPGILIVLNFCNKSKIFDTARMPTRISVKPTK